MTKIEETEEYFFQQILTKTNMTGRDVRILMTDLIYAFKSDLPTYNKELEEENAFLSEQLKTVLEKFQSTVDSNQEVLSDVDQAMALRVMEGK